jgi:hypothetical protein
VLGRSEASQRALGRLGRRGGTELLELADGACEVRVLALERRSRRALEQLLQERQLREADHDRAQVAPARDPSQEQRQPEEHEQRAEDDERSPDEPVHGRRMVPRRRSGRRLEVCPAQE